MAYGSTTVRDRTAVYVCLLTNDARLAAGRANPAAPGEFFRRKKDRRTDPVYDLTDNAHPEDGNDASGDGPWN